MTVYDDDATTVTCPYCFESVEVWLEPDVKGQLVQDCEVCCNPWALTVWRDEDGHLHADAQRAQ